MKLNDGSTAYRVEYQPLSAVPLRDWFAALAMQAIAALPGLLLGQHDEQIPTDEQRCDWIAGQSYDMADAMLAERARESLKPKGPRKC